MSDERPRDEGTEDLPLHEQPTERIPTPDEVSQTEPPRPPLPPDVPTFEDLDDDAPPGRRYADPEPTQGMPEVEELTFTPRPEADVTPMTFEAPEPEEVRPFPARQPRPTAEGRVLHRRRFTTLAAAAEALLPAGGPIDASGADVAVPERIDRALARMDPAGRRALERALRALERSTLLRSLRPFSRLSEDRRAITLARARRSRSPLRRRAAETVAAACIDAWAAHPDVEGALGFTYRCVTNEPPQVGDPLEVLGYPRIDRDHTEECDVVVVGSGAGGSVVAKELAEVGLSVIVLEEGAAFTRQDFSGPPLERARRMYRAAGATWATGVPAMPLPQGLGVGGSTLVSAGTAMRAPARVLDRWGSDAGIDGIDAEAMRPFYDRVERNQHVQPVPEALLGPNARAVAAGVEKLGFRGAPLLRMIEGCRGCGVCSWGCPSDAKLSTHLTYLPRAQRAGASIYAGARAERILVADGRAAGVVASVVDPGSRAPKATLTVRAKMVVLAAGAIHTPALLARNALGNGSGHLGRHLHVGPVAGVAGFFEQPLHAWRGTLQAYGIDDWHESHGLLLEATAPVPSAFGWTFPSAGSGLKEMLGRAAHVAGISVLAADPPAGRVIARGSGELTVVYRLGGTDTKRIVRGIVHAAEILLAAGARGVITGLPGIEPVVGASPLRDVNEDDIKAGRLRLVAQHPGGTARMGPDPAGSVTDAWGQVHGVEGLFVADASVLPGSPTVNPQLTIMALATRTADHIARHQSRWF